MDRCLSDNFRLAQDWQLGKPQSESMLCLLRAERYADVWFICKDQDKSNKTDRVAAHKLILASKSPVFEAMFYGDLEESDTEIELPDIEKIPFLLFLRYLYSDDTDLSEERAMDVMRVAHKYQITTCLDFCSKFLREILKPDNACYLLEHARLLDDNDLFKAATDFIDDNAPAVIESEAFKDICPETLEYILKGNTFFAPEVDIIRAVDEWASYYLVKNEMIISSAEKRSVMGSAFYYLRLPTLCLHNLICAQLKYDYLTTEELMGISKYIMKKSGAICSNSVDERHPRKTSYFISVLECKEASKNNLTSILSLICKRDIELEEIILILKRNPLSEITASCTIETLGETKRVISVDKFILKPVDKASLKFAEPVKLHASNMPYKICIAVTSVEKSEQAVTPIPSVLKAVRRVIKETRKEQKPLTSISTQTEVGNHVAIVG